MPLIVCALRSFAHEHEHPFLVFGAANRAPGSDWDLELNASPPDRDRVGHMADATTPRFPTQPRIRAVSPARSMAATQAIPMLNATLTTMTSFVSQQAEQHGGVYAVTKSERNPYAGRISVGRAATCDLVVPTMHVSKLHAHFLRTERGTWELRDAKSTNGSFVNSRRANPGEHVPIGYGDVILFGTLEARFVDAQGLHDLVNARR